VTARCLGSDGQQGPTGDYDPSGWTYDQRMTRLTLFPYRMGGYGDYKQGLVAVYRATVIPKFEAVVDRLYVAMKDGAPVEFSVTAVYGNGLRPSALVIRADVALTDTGEKEVTIANEPAPAPPVQARMPGELPEITRLKRLLPPPKMPQFVGTPGGWATVEKRLGLTFPEDYRQWVAVYGDGVIGSKDSPDFFRIPTPFTPRDWNNFENVMKAHLDLYRDERQRAPTATPGPAWPETGGLLPFGSTSNGDVLYWRTRGAPAEWTVVIQQRGGDKFFRQPVQPGDVSESSNRTGIPSKISSAKLPPQPGVCTRSVNSLHCLRFIAAPAAGEFPPLPPATPFERFRRSRIVPRPKPALESRSLTGSIFLVRIAPRKFSSR
jgi:hypothetical protein